MLILNTDTEYTLLVGWRIFFYRHFFIWIIYTSGFFIYKIFLCCIYEEQYGGVHVSANKDYFTMALHKQKNTYNI